jgi:hypothetical protein
LRVFLVLESIPVADLKQERRGDDLHYFTNGGHIVLLLLD